jgi:hypothetical protein
MSAMTRFRKKNIGTLKTNKERCSKIPLLPSKQQDGGKVEWSLVPIKNNVFCHVQSKTTNKLHHSSSPREIQTTIHRKGNERTGEPRKTKSKKKTNKQTNKQLNIETTNNSL